MPAQVRSQQLVTDILEATAQVLEEAGYDGLSTNKIARRAGVSIGSVYQYFANKDELLEAYFRAQYEQLSRIVLLRLLDIMEQPFAQAASICIKLYVEFLAGRPRLTRLLMERLLLLSSTAGDSLAAMNIDEERALQVISTYLLRHQAVLAFTDLKAATYMVYNTSMLMGMRIALQPAAEREHLVGELVKLLSLYVGDDTVTA